MRLYLDSAPIIYFVEGSAWLQAKMTARLAGTRTGADLIVVSHLSRLECRVKPMRDGDRVLLDKYDRFFDAEAVELVEIEAAAWDAATELRARHGLRVPDALHIACAITHRCDRFLTNDHRLDRVTDIPVEVVAL
jgi:predicted nucleic acid-binding protein